jgi:hypothetical protein
MALCGREWLSPGVEVEDGNQLRGLARRVSDELAAKIRLQNLARMGEREIRWWVDIDEI